jgi:hypothetical protein
MRLSIHRLTPYSGDDEGASKRGMMVVGTIYYYANHTIKQGRDTTFDSLKNSSSTR